MHVVERVEFSAAFAGLAQEIDARRLSYQCLLQLGGPHRGYAHAAERDGCAGDPVGSVGLQQHGSGHDGEIAMAPREFDKGVAVTGGPPGSAPRRIRIVALPPAARSASAGSTTLRSWPAVAGVTMPCCTVAPLIWMP